MKGLQRSALFVPANNPRAIEKVSGIDTDWILFDLEDSIAAEHKADARKALITAFENSNRWMSQTAIRCNHVSSDEFKLDLEAIAVCRPKAVVLPKISSVSDVELFASLAESVDLDTTIGTWFMVESASAIAQLEHIVRSGVALPWSLETLLVGHNDLASDTGVSLDLNRIYLMPWLMQIILQAKQSKLQVLDSVWNKFRDGDGFEQEAMQGKHMGFDGKALIHPAQVEPANRIFSPSAEEIESAKLIVDTFHLPENKQQNVLNINGEMVERLHLNQAQRLLDKYSV